MPPQVSTSYLALVVSLATALASALAVVGTALVVHSYTNVEQNVSPVAGIQPMPADCNVLGIQVHGSIVATRSQIPVTDIVNAGDGYGTLLTPNYTVANQIEDTLALSSSDANIRALVVDVDSLGGSAAAGYEIAQAIRRFSKPSVSVVHDFALSSGYLAAAAAQKVYANGYSTVGSIGATYSFLNQSEKDRKDGIVYMQLSSGPYKDMFSPDKPLTNEERTLIERDLRLLHDGFVQTIVEYRKMPRENVEKLADGSSLLGISAKEKGLVDDIGGLVDATQYLEGVLGEPVSICWQ